MKRLEYNIHTKIEELCEAGDRFAQNGHYSFALKKYWTAYDLLPEPKEDWIAGTWILAAIGDTNFLHKDFQAGADNIFTAMYFPCAVGNPFLHLRLGQCYFELGELEKAKKELAKAYNFDGEELFSNEDPKYFNYLNLVGDGEQFQLA
jgi:tetratricopeptide (TPR) repeat protein